MPPRFAKHQQQIRSYLTGSSQTSYQSTNPNFFDDRRVINNSASLRITVSNNSNHNRNQNINETNYDYQHSQETCLLIILVVEYYFY
jgi:hypothetical protein